MLRMLFFFKIFVAFTKVIFNFRTTLLTKKCVYMDLGIVMTTV